MLLCYCRPVPFDTLPEALRVQIDAQRRLGGERRFRTACVMSQSLRKMAVARIRAMHPDLDDQGILDQLVAELYDIRRIA